MADSKIRPGASGGTTERPIARVRKAPAQHPKFIDMVIEAILAQTDRKGVSLAAIKSHIAERYPTVDPNMMKSNVRRALERGLTTGIIVRPKASEDAKGITGRFKIDKVKHAAMNKPKKPKTSAKSKGTETTEPKPAVKKVSKKEPLAARSPKQLKTPKKTSKSKTLKAERTKPTEKATKPKVLKKTKATPAGKGTKGIATKKEVKKAKTPTKKTAAKSRTKTQ